MSLDAAIALRDQLKEDADILSLFSLWYGSEGNFPVGISKDRDATEYPHLSFVPGHMSIQRGRRSWLLLIIVGVCEPEYHGADSVGVQRCGRLVDMLLDKLGDKNMIYADGALETRWDGTGTIISDMGQQHPYYEMELQLNMVTEPL